MTQAAPPSTPLPPTPLPPPSAFPDDQGGVPMWLPLAAALIALAFAAFIGVRICPTLSALVTPPEPVLPANSVLKSRESKGTEDQWLYTSSVNACIVAKLYQETFKPFENGGCLYDPSAGCSGTNETGLPANASVARCGGKQSISNFNVQWSVVIATGENRSTIFRIYREVN